MSKAQNTRLHILNKSFDLIYVNGYQATSVDKIIETTQVTKGAFYYHFKDKEDMGLAMIDDVLLPRLNRILINPLSDEGHPLDRIYNSIKTNLLTGKDFDPRYGCPMNNLIQEMSPISSGFKTKLKKVINHWREALISVLDEAKNAGQLNSNIEPNDVANFIIVGYEGLRATGKLETNMNLYKSYIRQLKFYLDNLK
ncbi:MAG: TetR/AcrR family transcriptional regulator [Winogradskyella sp.]|uniref:TetR/AcrR family transcriptional regulator n=1 Tax=Winogradskyella sp. TaxID=1883156 RepID=UPI000F3C8831|nr:TetR/AcrR family transcriptional regulator [Winogradskyella sp.]RNC86418.1 MAG: TetR/AcrR family transcriptional regulator [Winogradskyella sp.]